MAKPFTIGEEVMYDEERYVIADITTEEPKRYRLLLTSKKGTRVEWVREKEISKMANYLTPYDDTALYK